MAARSKQRSMTFAISAAGGILSLLLSFQNCAPAPMSSATQGTVGVTSEPTNVPMSKVLVTLQHPDGAVLSNVQLVADDVNVAMDEFAAHKSSSAGDVEATENPSSFSLNLPLGEQKIIVARGKLIDSATGAVSNVYGNTVVTVSEALGNVTINLVVLP